MWSLLTVTILSWLAPASSRPQTPFFDFKSFNVPASRFNTEPVRHELKTFSPLATRNNQFSSFAPTPIRPEVNQEFVSFAPIEPENNQDFASFAPEEPEDNQDFVSFAPIEPENNQDFASFAPKEPEDNQEFVSFAPVESEEEQEITRFSPIPLEAEKETPMLLPLTIEDGKPMTDVFSMAGPPYSKPDEDVMDTVKMVPFINLGESPATSEAAEPPTKPELMSDKLVKPVMVMTPPEQPTNTQTKSEMAKQMSPEVSEKPSSPMTKHTLIQMAVDRLKDMEEKKEVMEIMKSLKEDNLYVLQPVVEGDIIKVSDHPTMDGMNIIEFVETEN